MKKVIQNSGQEGFTLLEILIVTLLLAFLAIATFSSIRMVLRDKAVVDFESEALQEARAVLAVIERDIAAAYLERYEDLGWNPTPKSEDPNEPPPPQGVKPTPITIFQGKANDVFLSARSHQRMAEDSPENEFHFVTYQMEGQKIVRAETERATSIKDRESQDRLKQFILIDHVKSLKFSYWDPRSERWEETWDTEKSETQDLLPEAVKIELEYEPEITRSDGKKVEGQKISTVIRITEAALRAQRK